MLRTELSGMIALAERLAAVGEHAVLATLFSSSGSTYRPLGSMMVSAFPSMIAGGVSGGCIEQYVARVGRSLTQEQSAAMLSFNADPDSTPGNNGQPVLGCGGAIEVLVESLTPNHIEFLRQMNAARASDTRSLAACVIDTSAQPSIAVSRFWLESGWHGKDDPQLERLRQRSVAAGQSRHGALDASRLALIHYIPPMTRLVILGAGDDTRPLCTLAQSLGWHVTVADRRGRLATRARFPDADDVVAVDWATAVSTIDFTPRTAVIMMTHSLPDDIRILPLLSDKPMFYLGVLGPEHRRDWLLDAVEERTGLSEIFAARVHGPIGLNLGDRSATGIAVSIVAEILARLNGRDARPLSNATLRSPARPRSGETASHA
jgi:xanthine/CO dehydrogenase XdhC/CoxF family maturation factor